MKVFLSWSGTTSHQVALVFREWLPSVIQALVPYVSSEDIDKGARWSTDIAKELEDSSFGILCVTRENINAPWLIFEAGALSKSIDSSYVCPFLFDIKRSDVSGPILQFQSTTVEQSDVKKLIMSLNRACGAAGIPESRFDKVFEVWYPELQKNLDSLKATELNEDIDPKPNAQGTDEILEEVLELARINQKLLRKYETSRSIDIRDLTHQIERYFDEKKDIENQQLERFIPELRDEFVHYVQNWRNKFVGIRLALALVRTPLPWIYDIGNETINIITSNVSNHEKHVAITGFRKVLEYTIGNRFMRDPFARFSNYELLIQDIPDYLINALHEIQAQEEQHKQSSNS